MHLGKVKVTHLITGALQAVNRAGFLLMSKKNHKGMWLKKCSDLVPEVLKKHTVFYVFKYDIKKNFFTNVLSSFVKDALHFFLLDNENILEGFWVHKKN